VRAKNKRQKQCWMTSNVGPDLQKNLTRNLKFILSYKFKILIDIYMSFTRAIV